MPKIVEQLESLKSFFTELEDLPEPTTTEIKPYLNKPIVQWLLFSDDGEFQKSTAQTIVKMIPGEVKKCLSNADRWMEFTGTYLDVNWEVIVSRNSVCKKVVTGTETVTEEVPDPEAPMITRTVEKEIVEWECEPLLASR